MALRDHLGPPGQIDPIIAPLDALRAAGRLDHQVASRAAVFDRGDGRGAGASARRLGRPDSALPNEDRARDRARRPTPARRSSPPENAGAPPDARRSCGGASSFTSPRTTHCGLPTRRVIASMPCPSTSIVSRAIRSGLAHRRAKGVTSVAGVEQLETLLAGLGANRHRLSGREAAGRAPAMLPGIARRCRKSPTDCRRRSAAASRRRSRWARRASGRRRQCRGGDRRRRARTRRGQPLPAPEPRRARGNRCRRRAP